MADIFNYLYDGFQQLGLRQAQRDASSAKYRAADAQLDLRQLQKEHERLKLVTMALWELLKERTSLSDNDLKHYIEKVDQSDGERDGRAGVKGSRHSCEECGHLVPTSAIVCAYCGTHQPQRATF